MSTEGPPPFVPPPHVELNATLLQPIGSAAESFVFFEAEYQAALAENKNRDVINDRWSFAFVALNVLYSRLEEAGVFKRPKTMKPTVQKSLEAGGAVMMLRSSGAARNADIRRKDAD